MPSLQMKLLMCAAKVTLPHCQTVENLELHVVVKFAALTHLRYSRILKSPTLILNMQPTLVR